ncbi:MAG: hypothetical protein KC646_06985 [Candidatus Cloacimonetes bacterium]|nr:hypothetical protein [Candidatus Cloacimonadota bacterium]
MFIEHQWMILLICGFLCLNRLFFINLPLHGDIGFFGIWGHFKDETLDHDLIMHNGGFRAAAIFMYALFRKIFLTDKVKIFSRLGQLSSLLFSLPGYYLLFTQCGLPDNVFYGFAFCFAILTSSYSTGCVFIYSVELLQVSFVPYIFLLYFLPIAFVYKCGLAIFLSLLFKLNLPFDVVFFYFVFYAQEAGLLNASLETGGAIIIAGVLFLIYLALLGCLRTSILGFLAFFRCRNVGWQAYKRLFWPFLLPMIQEHLLILIMMFYSSYHMLQNGFYWPLGYLAMQIFGLVLQRGFFHYHYTCLFPSFALVGGFSFHYFLPNEYMIVAVLLAYSVYRYMCSKTQIWPKPVEHQGIFNEIVESIEGTPFEKVLRESKSNWHAGWRFQMHMRYDSPAFSVHLQTIKFMMVFDEEQENQFMPEFCEEFYKRLVNKSPDLLVIEENQLVDVGALRRLGYDVNYFGTIGGRLSFYHCKKNEKFLGFEEFKLMYQDLFVGYPANFELDFFKRLTPQYIDQICDAPVYLVGENQDINEIKKFFEQHHVSTQQINEDHLESSDLQEGNFFLISEGRSISFYNKIHLRTSDRLRIFKYT